MYLYRRLDTRQHEDRPFVMISSAHIWVGHAGNRGTGAASPRLEANWDEHSLRAPAPYRAICMHGYLYYGATGMAGHPDSVLARVKAGVVNASTEVVSLPQGGGAISVEGQFAPAPGTGTDDPTSFAVLAHHGTSRGTLLFVTGKAGGGLNSTVVELPIIRPTHGLDPWTMLPIGADTQIMHVADHVTHGSGFVRIDPDKRMVWVASATVDDSRFDMVMAANYSSSTGYGDGSVYFAGDCRG